MTIAEFIREFENIEIKKEGNHLRFVTEFESGCWGKIEVENTYPLDGVERSLSEFASYVNEKKSDAYWSS